MRLRSQLALGFLVLAILPLAGIVLFTYASSLAAVERALETEAASLARDMDGRMGLVRQDLELRLARVAPPSDFSALEGEEGFVLRVLREIAPVAPLVDSVEFLPAEVRGMDAARQAELAARSDEVRAQGVAARELAAQRVAARVPTAGAAAQAPRVHPTPRSGAVHAAPAVFPPQIRIDVQEIVRQAAAAGRPLGAEAERGLAGSAAEIGAASAEIAAAATMAMLFSGQIDEADLDRRIAAFVSRAEDQARVRFADEAAVAARHREAAEAARRLARTVSPVPVSPPAPAPAPGAPVPGASQPGASESLASEPAGLEPGDGESAASDPAELRAADPAPALSAPPAARGAGAGADRTEPPTAPAVAGRHAGRKSDKAVCEVEVPVREGGEVVGHVKASLSESVLRRLLSQVAVEEGDVPFAVDADGAVYLVDDAARARLGSLALDGLAGVGSGGRKVVGDWVVATAHDEDTGLTFGVARPMGGALAEVRRSAARNFGFGLGFVALAGLAVPVLSRRMTRQMGVLTEGAQRIARGDLTTRLPVASGNEIGQLASAFNHMAHDLSEHQVRLLAEERRRQEREVEERLLRADHARKSAELEEARAFQLSLLPRTLPAGDGFDLAVFTRTAAEVGGDFYDFHLAGDGTLTVAVGDATGHGARAGTMVAVTKSLFSSYTPEGGPAEFLGRAAQAVRRMELGRMGMALLVARLSPPGPGPRRLTVATAGMPPVLVRRGAAGGAEGTAAGEPTVEEVYAPGMPLGGLDTAYVENTVEVAPGDVVVLTTDGFPELADAAGDPLGYGELRRLVATAPAAAPDDLVRHLAAAVTARTAGGPPNDDVTFVVVRV
jgi:serine phosphatase RsbU (regulator of sigma subunit)